MSSARRSASIPARRARRAAVVAAALAAACLPGRVSAQVLERFVLRGEGAGGFVLGNYQPNVLRYGPVVQGSARLGFSVVDWATIQASFSSWFLPSSSGDGQQYSVLGGLRLEPHVGIGRVFLDGNVGLGQTASLARVALDVGAGYEFDAARWLALGPVVRYNRTFAQAQDFPVDAEFLTFGLSVSLRVPGAPPAASLPPPAPLPADRDGDGVLDRDDVCPTEPVGLHPDPDRHGCPVSDADDDGVPDPADSCPDTPQGSHPDPQRRGCPASDPDRDGVVDPTDVCPTTPQGPTPDPDRAGCPDGDRDGDGVTDHRDQCPTEAQGLHPDPTRRGCPAPDRDGDTVPDPVDACPDRPGAPSPNPQRNGCPGLVRIVEGQLRISTPVFFATNQATILPRSRPVLEAVADALRAVPEIRRVSIEGHTDDVGDDARNLDLSQRRAESVRAWLVARGVEADRLEAHGYGETRPLAAGASRAARATNRRVEFHITDPQLIPSSNTAPEPAR